MSTVHPSVLHVTGRSRFIADEPAPAGMLHLAVLASPHAKARIIRLDTSAAAALPGVVAVLTREDIPGENQIGHIRHDEPLLPTGGVSYVGQPVAVVAAANRRIAENAAGLIAIDYEEQPPVLTIDDAMAREQYFAPPKHIVSGDVDAAMPHSAHIITGEVRCGGQEHFYMETQTCLALPEEGRRLTIQAATQATSEVQEMVARILGLPCADITVELRRLGGAFGGKERGATIWACLAALACHATGRPVELHLSRVQDMAWTGKRHPFLARYKVGFDDDGRLRACDVQLFSDGGAFLDLSLPILERAMLHMDNAYHVPALRVTGRACRTNLPPNTAMRGFGAPQGIFVMESIIERVARVLDLDPIAVRRRNCYRRGQTAPYGQPVQDACGGDLLTRLESIADYPRLRREVDAFNREHPLRKRGLGVVALKFGISFTTTFLNQGSAMLWILRDGSVSLAHGGVEMGQSLHTKVAMIVADELGVPLSRILQSPTSTATIANASPTAASTGSDLNGQAALNAARTLRERLRPVAARLLREQSIHHPATGSEQADVPRDEVRPDCLIFADNRVHDLCHPDRHVPFAAVAAAAHMDRICLGAHGFAAPGDLFHNPASGQGHPFAYFVFGCALVMAEVDLLSGLARLQEVHIVHDAGRPLHRDIDRAQIIGAFCQGFGWCTMEELVHDRLGRCLTVTPSTYKVPTYRDLPAVMNVDLPERPGSCAGVRGSKGIGEPPFIYGEAAFFAIRNAIESVRNHARPARLRHPATPEAVLLALEELRA